MWAEANQQTLLMADTSSLRMDFCNFWNCSRTLRLPTQVDNALNPYVLRTTMARSTNDSLALAYLNFDSHANMRLIYMPNYNQSEVLVLDRWRATRRVNSPLFLRFDTSGRAIIGYQRFESNSYTFRILRVNLDGRVERLAEWSLNGPIYEISTAPKQTISDVVYVGLAGITAYTFTFTSFSASLSTPNSSPMASTPSFLLESNYSSPEAPLASNTSALDSSTELIGWNNTDMVIIAQTFAGRRYGFQITIDLWDGYGPIFAVSYVTLSGMMSSIHGTCPISGCTSDSITTWNTLEYDSSPFSADTLRPPSISSTFGFYRVGMTTLPRWRVTLQYPRAMFHLMNYTLPSSRHMVSSSYYNITFRPLVRYPSDFNMPTAAVIFMAIGCCILCIVGCCGCNRLLEGRARQVVAVPQNDLSPAQLKVLSLYYTSLREN